MSDPNPNIKKCASMAVLNPMSNFPSNFKGGRAGFLIYVLQLNLISDFN